MADSNSFIDYLFEQFQLGGIDILSVRSKRMFGGHGIYFNDIMFALVADDELYLKTGENNIDEFKALGLAAFSYERNGKRFDMSYSTAPTDMYDDADEIHHWVNGAIDAAVSAHNRKTRRKT